MEWEPVDLKHLADSKADIGCRISGFEVSVREDEKVPETVLVTVAEQHEAA